MIFSNEWTPFDVKFENPFEQSLEQLTELFQMPSLVELFDNGFDPKLHAANSAQWINQLNELSKSQLKRSQQQFDANVRLYWDWTGQWLALLDFADQPAAAQPVAKTRPAAKAKPAVSKQVPAAANDAVSSENADDLTAINGIGPAIAKKLAEQGITRLAQLAALTEADVERLESEIIRFSGRIAREDWIGQAKAMIGA